MLSSKPYISLRSSIIVLSLVSKVLAVRPAVSSSRIYKRNRLQKITHLPSATTLIIEQLRGGGGTKEVDAVKSKKKRKGKSSKKSSTPSAKERSDDNDNNIIKDTKQQTEPTTSEETTSNTSNRPHNTNKQLPSYTEHTFDVALLSLGLSLGTSGTDSDSTHEAVYNQDGTKNLDTLAYYQYSFRNSVDGSRRRRRQSHQRMVVIKNNMHDRLCILGQVYQ